MQRPHPVRAWKMPPGAGTNMTAGLDFLDEQVQPSERVRRLLIRGRFALLQDQLILATLGLQSSSLAVRKLASDRRFASSFGKLPGSSFGTRATAGPVFGGARK